MIGWLKLFVKQTKALTKKNATLQLRNKTATATQLLIGVFFLVLLLLMDSAVKSANSRAEKTVYTLSPTVVDASSFANCYAGDQATDTCYDFVYTVEGSNWSSVETLVQPVITEIQATLGTNDENLKRLESKEEMDEWLLANPNRTLSAFYFTNVETWALMAPSNFEYIVRYNTTKTCTALGIWGCNDPMASIAVPLQTAIDSAFVSVFGTANNTAQASIKAQFSDFPHPDMSNSFDVVASYGPSFLYIAASFNYVIQLTLIVEEKENHLFEAMKQMGMLYSAYWTSWLIVNTFVNTAMVLFLLAFGAMFKLELFVENSFGLILTFFWLASMSFTAFAFLFSTLTRSTSTARLIGIAIFILTFIASPIIVPLLLEDGSESYDSARDIMSLFPIFSFYHVLGTLISKSSGQIENGMTWSERVDNLLPPDDNNLNGDSFWSVQESFHSMAKGFLVMTILAWYLDHVIPNEHGHRESIIFFLKPEYWIPSIKAKRSTSRKRFFGSSKVAPSADDENVDEDVKAEAMQVREDNFGDRKVAVKIQQLTKTFKSGFFDEPFHAVRSVEYAIDQDSTFVLLGHNGAGKSTCISAISGLADVTSGDATIFGHSVVNEMPAIQSMMGVCPQHDILWGQLTAREHLRLFATIKGVPVDKIDDEVQERLEQTMLTDAADQASMGYSGGMKRRLSIAIALIGDPKFVILDEPTTGTDLQIRRQVWDMISKAKKGRVILLTTHSMEEAEVLGDRIGIMSHGRMQALGTSLRLKKKFGSGYKMTITMDKAVENVQDKIKAFFKENALPGTGELNNALDGVLSVTLPRAKVEDLVQFFKAIESNQVELGIKDYSISQSTLEEVFLRLSKEDKFQEETDNANTNQEAKESKMTHVDRNTGSLVQFNALFRKSLRYQCTQCKSCCAIVTLPIFIMFLLLVVEQLVFASFRVEALCGEGIALSECIEKGTNLSCSADFFQTTFPLPPAPSVGNIHLDGRYGGINPNCNDVSCFEGLEKALYRQVPIFVHPEATSSVGDVDFRSNDDEKLMHFELDFHFLIGNSTCDEIYESNFDEGIVCEGVAASSRIPCQEQVRSLAKAKDYLEKLENSSSGFDQCLSEASSAASEPLQADIDRVIELDLEKEECNSVILEQLWEHFVTDDDGWNVSAAIANVSASTAPSGVLGSYGSSIFPDMNAYSLLGGLESSCLDLSTFALEVQSLMKNGTSFQDALSAASNYCSYLLATDIIRGVSFNKYTTGSREEFLQKEFLDKWFGAEVQTELMKEKADELTERTKYKARAYMVHWQGYEIHKMDQENDVYKYTSFYNNSGTSDTSNGNWQSLVWALDAAIVKAQTGKGISFMTESIPRKFKCNRDEWISGAEKSLDCEPLLGGFLSISILDFIAISLFPYLLMLHMFVVVSLIVYEKENRLRMIMKMMGLSMRVYWLVNYIFYLGQYLIMVMLMMMMGRAANLQMFVLHDSSVVLLFLFTWGNLLVLFSFFLSVFFRSSRTSTAAVFLFILVINTTGSQLLQTLTEDTNTTESTFTPMMVFPPLVMIRILIWLGLAGAFGEPITMANLSTYADGVVAYCLGLMWLHIFVFAFLVWYLDKVLVVGYGVSQPWNFFLKKSFWFPPKDPRVHELAGVGNLKNIELPPGIDDGEFPQDIKKEYERVISTEEPKQGERKPYGRIVRISKNYGAKQAVKCVSFGVNEGECFALLGANGAGKSSLLNILGGLLMPSSGNALVGGHSILSEMQQVHKRMGVCPQHDVIWDTLTARDHLYFYGRLKGLKGSELKNAVEKALVDVNLKYAAHRAAGNYSGGMKRRLSTAISIIGDPSLVLLDEPSTGLDYASRRQLWSVIERAKGNKSIILTTHSMEETEMLSDRIGIMASGKFQCIDVAPELKRRFAPGYTLAIVTKDKSDESHAKILKYVSTKFPTAKLRNEQLAGNSHFEIERKDIVISDVFESLESIREEYNIVDYALNASSLEDVFLYLSRRDGIQTDETQH